MVSIRTFCEERRAVKREKNSRRLKALSILFAAAVMLVYILTEAAGK